jgi:hypothetical protein
MYDVSMFDFYMTISHAISKPNFLLINETGISENIDIDLSSCILTDLGGLKRSLRKYGLDIVPSAKMMKVLVVKDE